jgi:hypothetical protein
MSPGSALKQGFRMAMRARPAVWVLLLVNLGLAALAGLPIYRGILRFTGYSLMSQKLASGLTYDWLTDFLVNSPSSLDRYASLIALVGMLSIPVNALLAGGVLGRFRNLDLPFSLAGFFRDVGRYAWRLMRLMILGLICYWIVFLVFNRGLMRLIADHTYDWQDDRAVFVLRLGAGLLCLTGLAFVNLVMDYARVKLVMEDISSAAEAFLVSLGFSLGRLRKAVTVYALPTLAGLALLGLYGLVVPQSLINASAADGAWAQYREPLVVALLFLVQQLVMFGRFWFRVATWASEWSYYVGSR